MDGRVDRFYEGIKMSHTLFFSFTAYDRQEYAPGRIEPVVRVPTPLVQIQK